MHRSTDHILTSHVGSLPMPKSLAELFAEGESARAAYFAALPDAVRETVEHELSVGLDVINDGEFSKLRDWSHYVTTRLGGYEMKPLALSTGPEQADFPEYYRRRPNANRGAGEQLPLQMVCTGPISYIGHEEIARDVANLQAAVAGRNLADAFMCSVSPDNINYHPGCNEYYATDEEFILANAAAMREEYLAITNGGFVLQIDMPVQKYNLLSMSTEQFRSRFARFIEILNEALSGIDREQVRVHICYGGGKMPHTGDIELGQIIDLVFKLNVAGVSYDQNARHEHEYHLFEELKVPDGMFLMPGVVAHTSDVIEHPKVIAERIVRLANLVGRENVIAGTDCGLGGRVPDEVAWAKFAAMVAGAGIATNQLF